MMALAVAVERDGRWMDGMNEYVEDFGEEICLVLTQPS